MHLISNFFRDISSDIQSIETPPEWESLLQTALGTENRMSRLLLQSRVASVMLRILGTSLGLIAGGSFMLNIIRPNRANLLFSLGKGIVAHDCLQAGFNIKAEIDALKSSDDKSLLEKAVEKVALAQKALGLLRMNKVERGIRLACPNTWICQPVYRAIFQK